MRAGVVILLLARCVLIIIGARGKSIVELLYFGNCEESDNTAALHFENTTFGMVASDVSEFNTTLVIKKDLDHFNCKVTSYRCKTADCELGLTVPIPNCCKRLEERGQFYSVFPDHTVPPIRCPLKKGRHVVTHATFNPKKVESWMQESIIFKLKYEFESHGKPSGCILTKMRKISLRVRKKD